MILSIQQLIKISLPSSQYLIQVTVPLTYAMFFLYLIVLGEILGLRYPRYLSFTLRCFQLLVQLVHCSRLGCAIAFVASPKYSSLRVNLGIYLQSCLRHQVSHLALGPCYQNVYFSSTHLWSKSTHDVNHHLF